MFRLGKSVIANYVRSDCKRRLRLDLYRGEADRAIDGVPDKDTGRPGLALITAQGRRYEREKFRELQEVFPGLVTRGADKAFRPGEETAFEELDLSLHTADLVPGRFLLEAEYRVTDAFKAAHGLVDLAGPGGGASSPIIPSRDDPAARPRLEFARVRPDILWPQAPTGERRRIVTVDGEVVWVEPDDRRIGIKIVDVKLAAEPSPSNFAELAYYGMTLAAWLRDMSLDGTHVVLADAAIWPGTHDASAIRKLLLDRRNAGLLEVDPAPFYGALAKDLATMPAEVVLGRVKRFLAEDLREALLVEDWTTIPLHVAHACSGCDYLGYKWSKTDDETGRGEAGDGQEPRHCWHIAARNSHLSLVAGLTKGACGKLVSGRVGDVGSLSALEPGNPVFEGHQILKAGRSLITARAKALAGGAEAGLADRTGTSAVMPRFSHIRVALSVDFDIGTGLAFVLGSQMITLVPGAVAGEGRARRVRYKVERAPARTLPVDRKSVDEEGRAMVDLMRHLAVDIIAAGARIRATAAGLGVTDLEPTVQVYIWDRLSFDQLRRMMGRHLLFLQGTIRAGSIDIQPLAWVFPPEQLLGEPKFMSTSAPITIVSEAVNSLVAANLPHHYSLIGLANAYLPRGRVKTDGTPWQFRVKKFFFDPLSDQIPSERGHEFWNRTSPFPDKIDHQQHRDDLLRAVRTKLDATHSIVERLTDDLKDTLSAQAPPVTQVFTPTAREPKVCDDGQIILQHARLNSAADRLEIDLELAMPPHRREALFKSIRLEGTLEGAERKAELRRWNVPDTPRAFVFRVSERSREAKVKVGDFDRSLMPEDRLTDRNRTLFSFKRDNPAVERRFPPEQWERYRTLREACQATVLAFDRRNRVLILETRDDLVPFLVDQGIFDFGFRPGQWGIVDRLHQEHFIKKKLVPALQAIHTPPLTHSRPLFSTALARVTRAKRARVTASVPAERFIWDADHLAAETTGRSSAVALRAIASAGFDLTPKQREAVERMVERRLSILWGPPGTGKSETSSAALLGLVAEAGTSGAPMRIAITGPTWVAIDNVARKLPKLFRENGLSPSMIARLSSRELGPGGVDEALVDLVVATDDGEKHVDLLDRLRSAAVPTIVAGTAHQLSRLVGAEAEPLFDMMLIDEASQIDVAHAVVAFTTLAQTASVAVVGDDLQMSPIHQVDPPEGAGHLVGSIYDFYRHYRKGETGVAPIHRTMLDVNYRSNKEIVSFVQEAGYEKLTARYPDQRIRLTPEIHEWPDGLPWSDVYDEILDPEEPLVAIIHPDPYSSQQNPAEADLVAGLAYRLAGRLMDRDGREVLDEKRFFLEGVGIVTPHRAQQAAVFERLDRIMPPGVDRDGMYAAVDTVERFQGQEKLVMLASFGLGDADQIAAEEEFLYSLNRFNVVASRAKAKLVVVMSRSLVDHLPRDLEALHQSRLLKLYGDGFLRRVLRTSLPGFEGQTEIKFRIHAKPTAISLPS